MAKKKAKAKGSKAGKARTKSQVYGELAEYSDLSRKQVACVFDGLTGMIKKDLGKRGPKTFALPGLAKIKVVRPTMRRSSACVSQVASLRYVP